MANIERAIAKWARIRSQGVGDGVLEVPSIDAEVATGYGSARYAIGTNGEPRLLVPCGDLTLPKGMPASPNLKISISRFKLSGRTTRFLDLTCNNRRLDSVFAELAGEVLFRLSSGSAPVEAVATTIADFVELLQSEAESDIEASVVLGLLGELIILERLVEHDTTALDAWVGPYEQRHDIRRGVHAIEVKTSGRSDARLVRVHGTDQLLEPSGGTLALFHVRLERSQHGAISVASMYDRLIGKGASQQVLLRGLAQLGCTEPGNHAWNVSTYELEGVSAYDVVPGFPRITPESFPNNEGPQGIKDVSYCIDLTAAASWEVGTGSQGELIGRLLG